MMRRRALACAALCALASSATAAAAFAQTAGDTVLRAAGPQYEARGVARLLHGSNWRELWTEPLRVPVLDLRTTAGGLVPERRGGGNQSITLHMVDAAGMPWIFRSIDKFPGRALPAEVRDAPAGDIIADHVSILHPGSHFMLPPLLAAVGVLHVQPRLYIMPDDPALGEFREDFAGMIGELEPRPNEGPDDTPGFAGSRSVKGSEAFLEDIEESRQHRLNEREFLRARLIDFVVGDPDRGTDQWRWARFGEAGAYTWRPIPVDRDWAFVRANGVLARLARGFYPKIARFQDQHTSIETLTYSSHILDRRLLTRLTRLDVAVEAERVRAALTDDVIDSAVASLPPPYAALSGELIAAALKARRDRLPRHAARFYAWLASDVDVRGTDEDDFVEIERRVDGSVLVRIWPRDPLETAPPPVIAADAADPAGNGTERTVPAAPYYERMFRPDETREVRVYLHGGDDHARITGVREGPITLRVIGGGGDDLLEDLAGDVRFYDDRGENRVVGSRATRFSDVRWSPPDPPEGVRANVDWAPDWGNASSFGPAVDYGDRAGVQLGLRTKHVRYGFRRLPYRWSLDVRGLYSPSTNGTHVGLELDYRMQNPARSAVIEAHASSMDSFHFHGFGNDSPLRDAASARIGYYEFRLAPALRWHSGPRAGVAEPDDAAEADEEEEEERSGERWRVAAAQRTTATFTIGPVFAWTDPRLPADAAVPDAVAAEAGVTRLGARAVLDARRTDRAAAPRRGARFRAEAAAYPIVGGAADAFGSVSAQAIGYVPLHGDGPHLALRLGGEHAFGGFPLIDAAFLGGRRSLRGLRSDRLAGDAAVHGAAELRVPVDTVTLLFRTELGVFTFADAGRVWYRGDSPGGWHTGYGAGAWLSAFGRAVSVAVANGEGTRVYAWLGLPF